MKKHTKYLIAVIVSLICASALFACGNKGVPAVAFDKSEYEIYSGEKLTADFTGGKKVLYEIISGARDGVALNASDGTVTFTGDVPSGYQIMVVARMGEAVSSPVVVTLMRPDGEVTFSLAQDGEYYTDKSYVRIAASPNYALSYSMEEEVLGISVNAVTGQLRIDKSVTDGTRFKVKANSRGGSSPVYELVAKTRNLMQAEYPVQLIEKGKESKIGYKILRGEYTGAKVKSVSIGSETLQGGLYSFDETGGMLTVQRDAFVNFDAGEYELSVNTDVHPINVTLKIADKIITNAEEIQAINTNETTLAGYYVLDADIDLKEYGASYDGGKGWKPIGIYQDALAPENTRLAFTGTFDGNGHVIKNLYINRAGDKSGFNCGFFGYIKAGAVVKNVGFEKGEFGEVLSNSYSGVIAGVNYAAISNCYVTVPIKATTAPSYKWASGIAGRNVGSIENCYVVAKVECSTEVGAIASNNQGRIENCYAFTYGTAETLTFTGAPINSVMFGSENEMINSDFALLGDAFEKGVGELPKLKQLNKSYYPREIVISNARDYAVYGESIQVEASVLPLDLTGVELSYEITGRDLSVSDTGLIDTSRTDETSFTVIVTADGVRAEKVFRLYETSQSVHLTNENLTLNAGSWYKLFGKVLSDAARQDVDFELVGQVNGIRLDGDTVYIAPYVKSGVTFSARAYQDGLKSDPVEFTVVGAREFSDNTVILIGSTDGVSFGYGGGNVVGASVNGEKFTDFTANGGKFELAKAAVDKLGKGSFDFVIETESGNYAAHLKICDKLINTAEEFESIGTDKNTLGMYYVLGADLDFGGKKLNAIGRYGSAAAYLPFTGGFDGNGHTVSNFAVETNGTDTFNLGLFGFVTGDICNLTVENASVTGTNFIGGIVGSLGAGGSVRNCTARGITLPTTAGREIGVIAGRNSGYIENCTVLQGATAVGKNVADGKSVDIFTE